MAPAPRPCWRSRPPTPSAAFAALGTYLANFQNEDTRYQYTQLSWTLEKILPLARNTATAELAKLFEPADKLFAAMNDDCVRTAKAAPL